MTIVRRRANYYPQEEIILRIAEQFGGIISEKLIFGSEKVTVGSERDIEVATMTATEAIKNQGMGSILAAIQVADKYTNDKLHDLDGSINLEVMKMLTEAAKIAESILKQEKLLLLHISRYLSTERIIEKKQLEEMVRKFGSRKIRDANFDDTKCDDFYKAKLEVEFLTATTKSSENLNRDIDIPISLNKGV